MQALARGCELITEKDACYGEVMATVDTIWRAAEAGETSSPIMAVAMLWQLAAQLKRETERRGDTLGSIRETRNKERLAPAVNYTYQHYDQKITLADLAREANMSVPNFSSVFRETYGIPPMEYLARIRLQNAADLLQNTDKKIIDIAEECGFFSISNFIKAFNNGMGMSPSRYRKECAGRIRPINPQTIKSHAAVSNCLAHTKGTLRLIYTELEENEMKLAVTRILAATASALFLTAMAASCGDNNKGGSSTPSKEEQSYDFGGMKITFADTWGKDLTPGQGRGYRRAHCQNR